MNRIETMLAGSRERLAATAVLVGVAGLLAVVPGLPTVLSGVLLAAFVLLGPGSAVLAYLDVLPSTLLIAVPGIGVSAVILATWTTTETVGLSPLLVLTLLAAATLGIAAPALLPMLARSRA